MVILGDELQQVIYILFVCNHIIKENIQEIIMKWTYSKLSFLREIHQLYMMPVPGTK
jgi:hypothetical protein